MVYGLGGYEFTDFFESRWTAPVLVGGRSDCWCRVDLVTLSEKRLYCWTVGPVKEGHFLYRGCPPKYMQLRHVFCSFVCTIVGVTLAVVLGKTLQRRKTAQNRDDLLRRASSNRDKTFRRDDLNELPEPVRRYFNNVLQDGQQYVDTVRLEQEGELRTGEADSGWKQFTATQYISTDPLGFFWNARVNLWPLISARIGDLYSSGEGSARISLLGLIPIGGDDSNPELNEGELLRYLAEAVWYPTALLPSEGVQWNGIDETTAEATLEYGGATATLTFHFSEDNVVSKVHAEQRPRRVDNGYEPTPWTGRWDDYETRNGIHIPTTGEVIWHLPDGDMEAWRGRLTDIRYNKW